MKTKKRLRVGQGMSLVYPVHNSLLLPLEYTRRDFQVVSMRSIADQPLSLTAFLKRPYLRRGLTLITGYEMGREKKFYLECAKGGSEPGLQFVLVDELEPAEHHEPIGRVFAPMAEDRQQMLDLVCEFDSLPPGFRVGVRAVSLV